MYLIRAESNNNLNNIELAKNDLKILMARNYQKESNDISILENTQAEIASLIDKERTKELSFEGHRLYDLTRNKKDMIRHSNTSSSVKQVNYPSYQFILPIPQKEIDVNTKMIQNEGY